MSSKINIYSVIKGHVSTLANAETSKWSSVDICTFYIFPLLLAVSSAYFCIDFSKEATNVLVTAGAIFTGLLLNLLLLVYDQKSKLPPVNSDDPNWREIQARHTVLKELYYNISYSTLLSLILVLISVFHLFIIDHNVAIDIPLAINGDLSSLTTTPLLVFIGINLVLTILMIIKRIHILLSTEA